MHSYWDFIFHNMEDSWPGKPIQHNYLLVSVSARYRTWSYSVSEMKSVQSSAMSVYSHKCQSIIFNPFVIILSLCVIVTWYI